MELGSRGSLDDVIKASHFKLSILQMRHITIDVALGLYAIHSVGFLHGDLKPDNVLLMVHKDTARGIIAKITDFGGSAKETTGRNNKPAYFTRLWAAPEVDNKDPDIDWKKADVYSYGLIVGSLWASNGAEFFDRIRYKRSSCFLSNAFAPAYEGAENDFLFLLKSGPDALNSLSNSLRSTAMDSALQKEILEFVEAPLHKFFWRRPTMEKLLVHLSSLAPGTGRNILEEKAATDADDNAVSKAQKNTLDKEVAPYIYQHQVDEGFDFSLEKPPLYRGEEATSSDTRNETSDDTSDIITVDTICGAIWEAIRDAIRDVKRPIIDKTLPRPEQYEVDDGIIFPPEPVMWQFYRDMNEAPGHLINRNLDDGFSLGPDCPPLHSTLAQSDDPDTIEALLQSGADLNQVYSGHTPISLAVARGRIISMIKLLIAGAKANSVVDQDTQTTLLHLAVRHGYWMMAVGLLRYGADIEAKDANSRTPIMEAVDAKQWFMIERLRELGADVSVIKGHIGAEGEFVPRPEGM
ncbi:hypothetical protein TsFJ059_000147 [Trichoderma semiorbis]|uniref:Protein kinase domain-containing protein n=1 Tax=Trichoderma semiorbis TaxID=1491008 RepID=A0A9P8KWS8_9HYPO|nr:hypothetical protein TsFJ059_000147 [Trichoderma semiorbis]